MLGAQTSAAPADTSAAPPTAVPLSHNGLPRDTASFTGREPELADVLSAAASPIPPIVVIDGMPGVGKSALAVRAAHRLTKDFPDGQFYLDLHGFTPGQDPIRPRAALRRLLTAVGVPEGRMPLGVEERTQLWRTMLAARRAVLVLDNAADAEQVRPLLPGTSGVVVIVTSRRRLLELDDVTPISLDVLSDCEAWSLLAEIVGEQRTGAEKDASMEVVRLCGFLPLAIRIAAARLRSRPTSKIAVLAAHLVGQYGAPAELAAGDRSVAGAFAVSERHLTPAQRRMFRLLGLVPGATIDAYLAAALTDLSVKAAGSLLEELVDVNLLELSAGSHYRFHDLLRRHARHAVSREPAGERAKASARMYGHYVNGAVAATEALNPSSWKLAATTAYPTSSGPDLRGADRARAWLDGSYADLRAAFDQALADGDDEYVFQLPQILHDYHTVGGRTAEWFEILRPALDLAVVRERPDIEGRLRISLGTALANAGDRIASHAELRRARTLTHEAADAEGEATALFVLGAVLVQFGRYAESAEAFIRASKLRSALGDEAGAVDVLLRTCVGLIQQGLHREAVELVRASAPVLRAVNSRYADAITGWLIGPAQLAAGDLDGALATFEHCLPAAREFGMTHRVAICLAGIAIVYRTRGRLDEALGLHEQALTLIEEGGFQGWSIPQLIAYGQTLAAAGRHKEALRHHHRALAMARSLQARYCEALALLAIAESSHADAAVSALSRKEAETILAEIGAVAIPLA